MAGLSVVLEAEASFPKCPQVISKANLTKKPPPLFSDNNNSHYSAPFLERCFLCHVRLLQGKDIFMYRGDRAFCSEECRRKQIFMDEESVKRDSCSLAAASAAEAARRSRKSRAVASGLA